MQTAYDSTQLLSDAQSESYFLRSTDYLQHLTDHGTRLGMSSAKTQDTKITASTAIMEFHSLLEKLRVRGPLILETSGIAERLLGQGSQFAVYRGNYWVRDEIQIEKNEPYVLLNVALKRPLFSLYRNQVLDLSDKTLQRSIKNMVHEVLALRHRALIGHPNIVQLIGWGEFSINGCEAPCLVLPLARCDLRMHLDSFPEMPWQERIEICTGVGRGIDALHKCSIIHGDVKFENILIFEEDGKYIPTISDFGFAAATQDGMVASAAGTPGWQAPEVIEYRDFGTLIPAKELHKADNYSYGLLVSRTMECMPMGLSYPPAIAERVGHVTAVLTSEDPRDRPSLVGELLSSETPVKNGPNDFPTLGHEHSGLQDSFDDIPDDEELPSLSAMASRHHYEAILTLFRNHPDQVPNQTLFALTLTGTDTDTLLAMLIKAAATGHRPSQALCTIVHRHFERPITQPEELITKWLQNAVGSGSWFAAAELQRRAPELLGLAQKEFRRRGGYNSYWRYNIRYRSDPKLFRMIHDGATIKNIILGRYGDASLLLLSSGTENKNAFLQCLENLGDISIDHRNQDGETALIRACMGGQSENVLALLNHGADPSIPVRPTGATCLHWLFNFPKEDQRTIAQQLLDRGADINAIAYAETPIIHYPFHLPMGSPLHWAVLTQSITAVGDLIALGADIGIRDGSDPYRDEDDVRKDPFHQQEFPEEPPKTLGLNIIDLAVKLQDFQVLEHLATYHSTQIQPLLQDVDEEGYSPFHRFHSGTDGLTYSGIRFKTTIFQEPRGSHERRERLQRCTKALVAMGFDINRGTSPQDQAAEIFGHTPLMLAVRALDLDMVQALLAEPQLDINARSRDGYTALMGFARLPQAVLAANASTSREIVDALVAGGIDIHARQGAGNTAVVRAAVLGLPTVVAALLAHGAAITDKYMMDNALESGDTVLLLMIGHTRWGKILGEEAAALEAVKRYIVDSESAAAHVRRDGSTMLHHAAEMGSPAITRTLLERGLDPLATCARKYQPDTVSSVTPLDVVKHQLASLLPLSGEGESGGGSEASGEDKSEVTG